MGAVAALVAVAAAMSAYLVFFRQDPQPTVLPPPPDPRTVRVRTLLRPNTLPASGQVVYGELNGTPPEEIVAVSKELAPAEFNAQTYVDAFAWDADVSRWVRIFDARTFDASGPNGDYPGIILVNEAQAGISQDVGFVRPVDFQGDGVSELVLGVYSSGATAGPLELWVLSVRGEPEDRAEYYTATERGGEVTVGRDDSSVVLEATGYRPDDPGCCPSFTITKVIDWDEAAGAFREIDTTMEDFEG